MAAKPKLGLRGLVSNQPTNPDELLLGTSTPEVGKQMEPGEVPSKIRFTNTLPVETFRRLHQLSFWAREDMSSILDVALTTYFEQHLEADRPLPEKERVKRKLP
ncbi:hypothetical protein SAMN00120144_4326 [Hymenobacter roseosalivarius DSM 11622]|uniref:Uncharacterized protein n=1 Tax=Hymenobacter roseosalivarius DSM 11622 TaxID=645990 RepID=A0A1W1W4W1_9BACT|nr:hypothetical protein [Hymenobacter roseosalivarius]SMC00659.1 hypothetical protein SAMN00120144_4326 [Hymenobacter roseosalivarius DSM 11622]